MKKVFVNGYGSIGSRITSFLKDDPEITVFGIGKYSPDEKVTDAISRGLKSLLEKRIIQRNYHAPYIQYEQMHLHMIYQTT